MTLHPYCLRCGYLFGNPWGGSAFSDAGKPPAKSAANAAITSVKPTGEDGK